jgi:hypothetical protein
MMWSGIFGTLKTMTAPKEAGIEAINGKVTTFVRNMHPERRQAAERACAALGHEWMLTERLFSLFESAARHEEEQSRRETESWAPAIETALRAVEGLRKAGEGIEAAFIGQGGSADER